MCYLNHKCNWCGKRKFDTFRIDYWCKWYGLYICEDCYDKKKNNILKGPKFK